jgi:hypothetical protein
MESRTLVVMLPAASLLTEAELMGVVLALYLVERLSFGRDRGEHPSRARAPKYKLRPFWKAQDWRGRTPRRS